MINASNTLFIRIQEVHDKTKPLPNTHAKADTQFLAQYVGFDPKKTRVIEQKSFLPLPALLEQIDIQWRKKSTIVILLPADRVFITTVTLPAKQSLQLVKAPAYVIEEQLIEPIESLHAAASKPVNIPRSQSVQSSIAAINRQWLDELYRYLQEAQISPKIVISEASLMPWQSGHIALLIEDKHSLMSAQGVTSIFENHSLISFLEILVDKKSHSLGSLERSMNQSATLHTLDVYGAHSAAESADNILVQSLSDFAQQSQLKFIYHTLTAPPLWDLAQHWLASSAQASVANLALSESAAFDAEEKIKFAHQFCWIIVIWFFCQIWLNVASGFYLNWRSSEIYDGIITRYHFSFPETSKSNTAAHKQIDSYIASHQSSTPANIIIFLNKLADLLVTSSGSPLQLSYLQYHHADKTVVMHIVAPDFNTFEYYRQQLMKAGISSSYDSLTLEADKVKGNLHVAVQ